MGNLIHCSYVALTLLFLLFASSSLLLAQGKQGNETQYTFIVHVSEDMKPPMFPTLEDWYTSVVASIKGLPKFTKFGNKGRFEVGIRYSYHNVFKGFSASLTTTEASALARIPGFLSTMKDKTLKMHTTRTPEFLGLNSLTTGGVYNPPSDIWQRSNYGNDVIIGMLDSGVWPERPSFDDTGMGPVPVRWKGICNPGVSTTEFPMVCNRKIIGARAFYQGYETSKGPINEARESKSARDDGGHGTHTASTAAGSFVQTASFSGYAFGVASGMAPNARLAIYKVCWDGGCFAADILAGFDAAIGDGVDIISISVGPPDVVDHYDDPIAIGSFAAMANGILTSASAGNDGPDAFTVKNIAPWILTVAASSLDRGFRCTLVLGNGNTLTGTSVFTTNVALPLSDQQFPLVYAYNLANPGESNINAAYCLANTLDPLLTVGRVVVCDPAGGSSNSMKADVVSQAGGVATIIAQTQDLGETLFSNIFFTSPATVIGFRERKVLVDYFSSAVATTVAISFLGTVVNVKPAPTMAVFSSRGPNIKVPEILKPDITAPGVNILAAWTGKIGPTNPLGNSEFNIESGTSMSCPHVSGLAALLKGIYPFWSISAIKSALMTTSTTLDNTGSAILDDADDGTSPSIPYVHGAGHVVAKNAMNPGLVYDINIQNYVDYLCSLNYSPQQLGIFTQGQYACTSNLNMRPGDLNYPSFSLVYNQNALPMFKETYSRTLLNVDATSSSTYTVNVSPPYGVKVTIEPSILYFSPLHESLSYTVTFEASPSSTLLPYVASYGSLAWTDGVHVAQSPIAFLWVNLV